MMNEVSELLNAKFLLNLVAIEDLKLYSAVSGLKFQDKIQTFVELKVLVLTPENGRMLENRFLLRLKEVSAYKFQCSDEDMRSLEFDTDEVVLTTNPDSGLHCLSFINASTEIAIWFRSLDRQGLTSTLGEN